MTVTCEAEAAPAGPSQADGENRDQAWVVIDVDMAADDLLAFVRDVQRLLRINSLYEFKAWEDLGGGAWRMCVKNLSNGGEIDTVVRVTPTHDGCVIAYEKGLKRTTRVRVAAHGAGAQLTLSDDYGGVPQREREARIAEVDKSLTSWGHDLHRYLRTWRRWSWLPVWRWYMRAVWQPMKPSARRIAFLLIATTTVEFAVFLFVFVIFRFEWQGLTL